MGVFIAADIYPVKSMRAATGGGVRIDEFGVTPTGLEFAGVGDRELFVAADSRARELTVVTPRGRDSYGPDGRENEHIGDRGLKAVSVDVLDEAQLLLGAQGVGELAIDLNRRPEGKSVPAALHRGIVQGFDVGGEAKDFISAIIGRPASLYRTDKDSLRTVGGGLVRDTLAADAYPYTLGVKESLAALHQLSGSDRKVNMRVYRPNLHVDTLGRGPFSEHLARRIKVGEAIFRVMSGSIRCVVTNLGEEGEWLGGGLRILRPRRGVRVDDQGRPESGRPEPIFCVNLAAELAEGQRPTIQTRAPVQVLEWGNQPNVKILS